MKLSYLNETVPGFFWVDPAVRPEVRAMLSAMVSRMPIGGIRQRYSELVDAIAQYIWGVAQERSVAANDYIKRTIKNSEMLDLGVELDWDLAIKDPEWSETIEEIREEAEHRLTEYPLPTVVQEWIDKWVGKYGHSSPLELVGSPTVFFGDGADRGVSLWTAYLLFDSPLCSGQEMSTRAVRRKDWPICLEAYESHTEVMENVTIEEPESHEAGLAVSTVLWDLNKPDAPVKKSTNIVQKVWKPHPRLARLHAMGMKLYNLELLAWKRELRKPCENSACTEGLVPSPNPSEVCDPEGDRDECVVCRGTGRKYPNVDLTDAFRPAFDKARWALPGTIATACSQTGNPRVMGRVLRQMDLSFKEVLCPGCGGSGCEEGGCGGSGYHKAPEEGFEYVLSCIGRTYNEALPGFKGMWSAEAVADRGEPLHQHLHPHRHERGTYERLTLRVYLTRSNAYLINPIREGESFPRQGKSYADPVWNSAATVFFGIPCSWAAARDWHRHRTAYPWEMFIRSARHSFTLHEDYSPISEEGKKLCSAYLSYAKSVYDGLMDARKPNMAMLAIPMGAAVTMEGHAGLRDAIYMLELRAGAKGTATAEYNPQAQALLRDLADQMQIVGGNQVLRDLNLEQYI